MSVLVIQPLWVGDLLQSYFHTFHIWLFIFNSFGITNLRYQILIFEELGAFAVNHIG